MSDFTGNQNRIAENEEEAFLMGQMAQSTGDFFAMLGRDEEARGEYLVAIDAYNQVLPDSPDFANAQNNKEMVRKIIGESQEIKLGLHKAGLKVGVETLNQALDVEPKLTKTSTYKNLNKVQYQTVPYLRVKSKDGTLVNIEERYQRMFSDVLTQDVVSLVDNARKGTVEAITYTIVDTALIIEATTTGYLVRARLSKAERIARTCSEYLSRLIYSGYQPHVREALNTTYDLILKQELSKIVGNVRFEGVEFISKNGDPY